MTEHPDIQVGSEVAVRDRRPPWSFLSVGLWCIYRVESITLDRKGRYNVRTTTGQCWSASVLRPLTDEIRAEVEHEARLCRVWMRLRDLVQDDVEWPERIMPGQMARLEELLTEIETLAEPQQEGEPR